MELRGRDWTAVEGRARRAEVQALLERCPEFFLQEYGRPARPEEVEELLAEGPPDRDPAEKTFLALVRDRAVFGVIDLLPHYRRAREAYLGLFVLEAAARGRGTGREVMAALEAALAAEGFDSLRLAASEQNPAGRRFWSSLGYRVTGVFPPRKVGERESVLYELEKPLVRRG